MHDGAREGSDARFPILQRAPSRMELAVGRTCSVVLDRDASVLFVASKIRFPFFFFLYYGCLTCWWLDDKVGSSTVAALYYMQMFGSG